MDWLVGILLLLIGAIIGFFVAKYFNTKIVNNKKDQEDEQTVKELMTQQASTHLHATKRIAEKLTAQCDALKQQIEEYEQLIISQSTGVEGDSVNYFGEHTTAYLRNKGTSTKNDFSNSNTQPLDFSSQGSGLFSGNESVDEKEIKQ